MNDWQMGYSRELHDAQKTISILRKQLARRYEAEWSQSRAAVWDRLTKSYARECRCDRIIKGNEEEIRGAQMAVEACREDADKYSRLRAEVNVFIKSIDVYASSLNDIALLFKCVYNSLQQLRSEMDDFEFHDRRFKYAYWVVKDTRDGTYLSRIDVVPGDNERWPIPGFVPRGGGRWCLSEYRWAKDAWNRICPGDLREHFKIYRVNVYRKAGS